MENRILIILLIFTSQFQGLSQSKNEIGKYTILTYGLQNKITNAELLVNQKWNIQKLVVAGCLVTQKLVDSVKTHNKSTWKSIENEKEIENSELNYRKDLINTRKDLERIKTLIYNYSLTNKIWKNLKDKRDDFLVITNPKFIDDSTYSISIKKRKRKINNKPKNRIYTLTIDLSTESMIMLI